MSCGIYFHILTEFDNATRDSCLAAYVGVVLQWFDGLWVTIVLYLPICTSKKVVYLDKFSVITNASQVRTVCRDLTNFVPSGQIFKRTADKICPG